MSEEFVKMFGQILTPLNSIIIAFITVCGTLVLRRRFTLQDRRQSRENRCDRIEIGYHILYNWSFYYLSMIRQVDHLRKEGRVDDEYVSHRVSEIASSNPPHERIDKYIQTGEGLEGLKKEGEGQ